MLLIIAFIVHPPIVVDDLNIAFPPLIANSILISEVDPISVVEVSV